MLSDAHRQIDIVAGGTEELREANRQLLDALDRLQPAEGRFQEPFRGVSNPDTAARRPRPDSRRALPHLI